MAYITEQEFVVRMAQIERRKKSYERKQKLKEARQEYKRKIKLPTTSKAMAVYLFMVLNVVLAFAMAVIWKSQDLTSLGILITDVVGQVLTYFIYAKKATAENTSADGTGIKFQAMMNEFYEKFGDTASDDSDADYDDNDIAENAQG